MDASSSSSKGKSSLLDVLRERDIPEETIDEMKREKLDEVTLCLMTDEQLRQYIPFAGDRAFIRNHCVRATGSGPSGSDAAFHSHKKTKLIQKLRSKLGVKIPRHESSDEEDSRSNRMVGNKNATKRERKVQFGWLHYSDGRYKQVRIQNGGGTRLTTVSKRASKETLIKEGLKLFFPNGLSCKGTADEFMITLLDIAKQEVSAHETVVSMYDKHKMPLLRLYLATKSKVDPAQSKKHESDMSLNGEDSSDSSDFLVDPFNSNASSKVPVPSSDECAFCNVDAEIPQTPEAQACVTMSHEDNVAHEVEIPTTSGAGFEHIFAAHSGTPTVEFPMAILSDEDNDETIPSLETCEVVIRRSNAFEDFISVFSEKGIMDKRLDMRMIETNGDIETGEGEGVFRDAVTEFWSAFCRYTNGDVFKVPVIRHDFDCSKWETIGRILVKGWKDTGYFPIIIAPSFMEECIFGFHSHDNILKSFMLYVSEFERDVLESALKEFPENTDELSDILAGYDCKKIPVGEKFQSLLEEIAHKELIQKPMFVINSWRPVVCEVSKDLNRERFNAIYTELLPTVKKVIALLKTPSIMSSGEMMVFGYLKKFIRSLSPKDLKLFLRFCTGSDIITCDSISVTFNQSEGFTRSPIAYTCTSTLQVPLSYETFTDLNNEFTEILRSNVWIMDLK